ncbi:MAG: hypothetical protein GW875_09810 [Deltaproteobacteria bacterium]|nr:hypothetical protein [Deltaproteobacteria bacterium]NCP04033.1 hypothetical protein [Deltaproteobacteria bacterium]
MLAIGASFETASAKVSGAFSAESPAVDFGAVVAGSSFFDWQAISGKVQKSNKISKFFMSHPVAESCLAQWHGIVKDCAVAGQQFSHDRHFLMTAQRASARIARSNCLSTKGDAYAATYFVFAGFVRAAGGM